MATQQDPPATRPATEPQQKAPATPALPTKTVGPKKFPKLKIMVPRRAGQAPPATDPPKKGLLASPQEARAPLAYGVILTPSNEWIDPGALKQKLEDNRRKRTEALGRSPATTPQPLGSPLTQFVRAHSATVSGTATIPPIGPAQPGSLSLRSGDDPDTPLHTPLNGLCLDA